MFWWFSILKVYVAWRAGTTTLYAGVNFIPPSRDYEFGWKEAAKKPNWNLVKGTYLVYEIEYKQARLLMFHTFMGIMHTHFELFSNVTVTLFFETK